MTVTIIDQKPSAVALRVEISWEEFLPHAEAAARRISKSKTINGFRPGNAPYWAAARDLGATTVIEEALTDAIPATLSQAVRDHKFETVGDPSIQIEELFAEKPVAYSAKVLLLPEIEAGDLSKVSVTPQDVVVKAEDVDGVINELRSMQAKEVAVDRPAEKRDVVTADLAMSIGGVPVEGGTARGHIVQLEKDHYVAGFPEQLVGMRAGETKTFPLPFPKDHFQKNLAGRVVDFTVTMTSVRDRQLPDVDDAFASNLGQKTVGDLRSLVERNLRDEKQDKEDQRFEQELVRAIIAHARFGEIPEFLVTEEARLMVDELEESVTRDGGTFEDYLGHVGKAREQIMLDFTPQAMERVKAALLLRHLARQNNVSVSDAEVEADIARTRKMYEKNPQIQEVLESAGVRERVRLMLRNKKVVEWLKVRVGGESGS